jgi:predicted nucleic acid-binding protein
VIVVSNATPLIGLSLIERLSLLPALYGQVYVPSAVYAEVVEKGVGRPGADALATARWLLVEKLLPGEVDSIRPFPTALGAGEIEVIVLALRLRADLALLDERLARKVAQDKGLRVRGTIGVLKQACERELVADLKTELEALRDHGVWINETLYREVLGD